jgi:hypothetical protein
MIMSRYLFKSANLTYKIYRMFCFVFSANLLFGTANALLCAHQFLILKAVPALVPTVHSEHQHLLNVRLLRPSNRTRMAVFGLLSAFIMQYIVNYSTQFGHTTEGVVTMLTD